MAVPPTLPAPRDSQPWRYAAHASAPSARVTISGIVAVLRRRRVMIAACFALTFALAVAHSMLSTKVYESSSMLRLDLEQLNLPQLVTQLSSENRISTEIELLQRRGAAVAVVDSLGLRARLTAPRRAQVSDHFALLRVKPTTDTLTLDIAPEAGGRFSIKRVGGAERALSARIGDTLLVAGVLLALRPDTAPLPKMRLAVAALDDAVREFQSALDISRPARDADLIAVRVRGTDRVNNAKAANLLALQLITGRQGAQQARTGSAVRFLQQQLDTLGIQLRRSEELLKDFRERAGVVNVAEQSRTGVGRLAQIQADRGAMDAERQALAMLLQQIRSDTTRAGSESGAPSRRLISFPTLFRNQAASELLGALARVENERSSLLTRRTTQDPDVQVLTTRIRELDTQLRGIAETYLQGLTNQVAALETVAGKFGGALDSLPDKEVRTARLERDVRVQQELYTLLQTRLKEAEITRAMEDPTISVVDSAVVASRPVQPKPLLNFALAFVIGWLIAMIAVVARELADQSVRSRADALQASGLPILGALPRLRQSARALPGLRVRHARQSGTTGLRTTQTQRRREPSADALRIASSLVTNPNAPAAYTQSLHQLYNNLSLTHSADPLKVLVFTSPLPGEGKTLSSINFALTLASRGLRVLLIDADLRCGLLDEVFDCPREPGFAELLMQSVSFEDASRRIPAGDTETLVVIPAGAMKHASSQLLTADRARHVMQALAPEFDVVIFDSPPVNLLADAAILGSVADAMVLVVRAGHTQSQSLRFAMDQLNAAGSPVIGTLLNDIDLRQHSDDGSYRYLADVERYYQPAQ